MGKRIAVIMGNPDSGSYCAALADAYRAGAEEAGGEVRVIDLSRMEFDPVLHHGYKKRTELEENLVKAQETIRWAEHLVFVYPSWWGSMPAVLKGFIDRTFLPGFAFQYKEGSPFPDKLLKGRSARVIVTMDTPSWYNRFVYGAGGHKAMKRAVLGFVGVKPVRFTDVGPVKGSDDAKRGRWLKEARRLGQREG